MSKFAGQSLRLFSQAVVVFVVLTGLLFSSGEGIRLLPFPFESAGDIRREADLQCGRSSETGYQKNIHRFEKFSLRNQTASPQPDNPQNLAFAQRDVRNFQFIALTLSRNFNNLAAIEIFKTRLSLNNRSNRAPPFA